MIPRVCSLFSGAGGIDIAFEQAGFSIVWANEIDHDACITYRKNLAHNTLVEGDIRKIKTASFPEFDVLTAGFPCQSFSIAGKQEGFYDKRNTGNLFFEICRILEAKKPKVVFLENVANLEKHDNGRTFRVIQEQLKKQGYFFKYLVANAADYGIPQSRNRIYIVCFSDKEMYSKFKFPKKEPLLIKVDDLIDRSALVDKKYYLEKETAKYKAIAPAILDETQIYRFHDNCIRKSHSGICFTLLAGMGYWPDRIPIIKDKYGIREITPKEAFSLQGFPETFDLSSTPEKSAYRQAGNAVCVPVVKKIADEIMKVMNNSERQAQSEEIVSDDTLVGVLRSRKQLEVCLNKNFYHFPKSKAPANFTAMKYVILYQTPGVFGNDSGMHYVGKISSFEELPRFTIKEIPKDSNDIYIKINVFDWQSIEISNIPSKPGIVFLCILEKLKQ